MNPVDLSLALVGLLLIVVALVSGGLKRGPVQAPLLAFAFGIAIGPAGAGWLDLATWTGEPLTLIEQAARLTLAISLMGVALRLDAATLRALWRPAALLIVVAMAGMFAVSSALAGAVLGLSALTAVMVGAAVTPTDPVVASAIVTGRLAETHLPSDLRAGLSLESGANDGLAHLFVMAPVLLAGMAPGAALERWLVHTLLVGVIAAAALGVVIGLAAAWALHRAERAGLAGGYSFLTYTVSLSLFTLGLAALTGADALICVFAAGLAFDAASRSGERQAEENVQEAVGHLFTLPVFVLFGLALPWADWGRLGWPLAVLALAVLVLRRLPVLLLAAPLFAGRYGRGDMAFLGWFGPIGVAALYYAAVIARQTGDVLVWSVVSAVVAASLLAHGVTAAPLTRLYARRRAGSP